ncbi:hypothetical protein G4Z16_07120 [Streptomyces bathyalis]|uniref:Uncharacterized protein n=1 Tax=Streptomyces bathyalis TaxID=2710756 RepID=A0A7T1WQ25_9ACTN|nr:hypothetical protein [Streptomyces bathyalis]QPP06203.1 hypothetical protein G4Z16_07120 [Streptomyces bathyalis]
MTSLLEQRYRRVLRMLPASYRAEREEEIVDTYLEDFDEYEREELRPSWREVASIAALAVRTRMGGPRAEPRYAVAGATVRLFALLSILMHGARELTDRALSLAWYSGAPAHESALFISAFEAHGVMEGVRATCLWLLPLCWVAAYAALLRDRRRTAFVFTVLANLPGLTFVVDWATGWPVSLDGYSVAFAASGWLTVLAVVCAFHSSAPPARLPVPPGLALMGSCVLMGGSIVVWRDGADSVWSSGTACVVAAGCWFAARARGAVAAADPEVPLALALLSCAVLAERAGMLVLLMEPHMSDLHVYAAGAQTAALTALAAALAVAGSRMARRSRKQLPARGERGSPG